MAMTNTSHLHAMSQEEGAELTRLNAELRAEKEGALKRAAKRHKDMMHANRRAERAEQLLEKESLERRDDKVKATNLFCMYKQTIQALEIGLAQAQQAGPSDERFQAAQAANNNLQAALVAQKNKADQQQATAEGIIGGLRAEIEGFRERFKKEAAQHYEALFAEKEKRLRDELSDKAQADKASSQGAYTTEIEGLKLQLQQAQQTVEWQKKQTQIQTAQRTDLQKQHMVAGVHAGFPLSTQQSPNQLKEGPNKRRRLDSMGNAGVPTPDRRPSRSNSVRSSAPATTPKRKAQTALGEQGEATQQQNTPARREMTPRPQQHPTIHASPLQQSQKFHKGPNSSSIHLQNTSQAQKLFSNFARQLNAQRRREGKTQLNHQEVLPLFKHWFHRNAAKAKATQSAQHNMRRTTFEQTGNSGQSPFMRTSTVLGQQAFTPSNMLPTSWGPNDSATQVPNMQQTPAQHQRQQPMKSFQNMEQGLESMLNHTADPMVTFTNDATTDMHATPPQTNPDGLRSDEGQLAVPLERGSMYSTPEDSQTAQDTNSNSAQAQLQGWASPIPVNDASLNTGSAHPASSNTREQDFGMDLNLGNFPTMSGVTMPSTDFTQESQRILNGWTNHQSHNYQPQQQIQDGAIDPALFFEGAAIGSTGHIKEHSSTQYEFTPAQGSMTETPTSVTPAQALPQHPAVSRKRPAAPSDRSTPAPSTRSTPAPSGPPIPTCLHCHENWWNDSCDAGEPCQNCIGSQVVCERPRCLSYAAGTCTSAKCPRVHEGDARYRNVVTKPKTLKRVGKKGDQKVAPSVLVQGQGQG